MIPVRDDLGSGVTAPGSPRKLNSRWGKQASGTWWTTSGSRRKRPDGRAVETVLHYIRRQPNPHVVWTVEDGEFGP